MRRLCCRWVPDELSLSALMELSTF